MNKFFVSEFSDKRMIYAVEALKEMGYEDVNNSSNAEFELLPPKAEKSNKSIDYLNNESFTTKNAYLTAEGAVALAIVESEISLISSKILIIGYGRIGKALHKYLSSFTNDIYISARNAEQRALATMNNANAITIDDLKQSNDYDFVFNTVPFPVMNEKEIKALKNSAIVIDLASFPGGIDKHLAQARGIKLVHALGVPAKYSPKTAGEYVAQAVDEIIKEGKI